MCNLGNCVNYFSLGEFCIQVNLSQENSEGAVFKVLPKFKVRSEGDDVS